METKINIAGILKDKPQGTKLYDLLRNIDVKLDEVHITDVGTYIECTSTLAFACVPQCVYRGFCPEQKSCGRSTYSSFKRIRKEYKKLHF